MHPSQQSIIERAEMIVNQEEITMFRQNDTIRFLDKEAEALIYRSRWRWVGVLGAVLVLIAGLITTPESASMNVGWLVGSCVTMSIGAIIGRRIYTKRSPW
jgi:hypothetical protein